MSVAVRLEGVSAGYDARDAVADVHWTLPKGALVALVGPNGAGKSTLLKLLLGLMRPRAGHIQVLERSPGASRRAGEIAYMPQHETIDWDFPANVEDVVFSARYGHMQREAPWRRLLPARWMGGAHQWAMRRALEAVDMRGFAHRHIGALSGGQKKRVLLARALAQDAPLMLLDEPLVGIDAASEALIFSVLRQARAEGRTVLLVTHDVAGAREHVDRITLFNRTVVAEGPPAEVLTDTLLLRTADPSFAAGAVGS